MTTVPHTHDDDTDFGARPAPEAFSRTLRADERIMKAWSYERDKAAKERPARPVHWRSPLDVLPQVVAARSLPAMPWPADWPDIERRARTYPGDCIGIVGGPASGKTQYAIQMARAFAAVGRGCVLWLPLELSEADIAMRTAANLSRRHVMEIREAWPEKQIAAALATVTDRWRFVDLAWTLETQIANLRAEVEAAKRIYQAPPLVVVDYVQLLAFLSDARDERGAAGEAIEGLRRMTLELSCYTAILSQTSRGNTPALAGKVMHESASDAIGVGAESSQLERACANQLALSVFKADDASELDAHALVTRTRHTGLEGRVGMRYHKQGGYWEELDHLPVTPIEVASEVKKAKRRKKTDDGEPPREVTPKGARAEMNGARAEEAASARRADVIAALHAAGGAGIGGRDLRRVKGSGSPRRLSATLDELEKSGRVRCDSGIWRLIH